MTTHELAQKLLKKPNIKVMLKDSISPMEVGSVYTYCITDDDAEMSGDCEDIVGQEVVVITAL